MSGFRVKDDKWYDVMIAAALTARKARKQAKRERQRKEKDAQVQESANRAPLTILPIEPDETFTGAVG